jgi:hypothetical protein
MTDNIHLKEESNDTEGHRMFTFTEPDVSHSLNEPTAPEVADDDDDDTEGHRMFTFTEPTFSGALTTDPETRS